MYPTSLSRDSKTNLGVFPQEDEETLYINITDTHDSLGRSLETEFYSSDVSFRLSFLFLSFYHRGTLLNWRTYRNIDYIDTKTSIVTKSVGDTRTFVILVDDIVNP